MKYPLHYILSTKLHYALIAFNWSTQIQQFATIHGMK